MSRPVDEPIGGFFGLELPSAQSPGLAQHWGLTDAASALWLANARSAFAALVAGLPSARVWLPAYICRELPAAVPGDRLGYYPLDEELSPRVPCLAARVRPGDVVLAVNYFGRAPGVEFRAFVASRPDVTFVEDAAQSIDTGVEPWGSWRLFSPRKVAGIPDGGILQPLREQIVPQQRPKRSFDTDLLGPCLMRFEDEEASNLIAWHEANQSKERKMGVSTRAMSRIARTLLSGLAVQPMLTRRRENFGVLAARLETLSWLPVETPAFVPFAFVLRVRPGDRDRVWQTLVAQRIFAARYWTELPSAQVDFPFEHEIARSMISLPVDHRYGPDDMERIAAAVGAAVR